MARTKSFPPQDAPAPPRDDVQTPAARQIRRGWTPVETAARHARMVALGEADVALRACPPGDPARAAAQARCAAAQQVCDDWHREAMAAHDLARGVKGGKAPRAPAKGGRTPGGVQRQKPYTPRKSLATKAARSLPRAHGGRVQVRVRVGRAIVCVCCRAGDSPASVASCVCCCCAQLRARRVRLLRYRPVVR